MNDYANAFGILLLIIFVIINMIMIVTTLTNMFGPIWIVYLLGIFLGISLYMCILGVVKIGKG